MSPWKLWSSTWGFLDNLTVSWLKPTTQEKDNELNSLQRWLDCAFSLLKLKPAITWWLDWKWRTQPAAQNPPEKTKTLHLCILLYLKLSICGGAWVIRGLGVGGGWSRMPWAYRYSFTLDKKEKQWKTLQRDQIRYASLQWIGTGDSLCISAGKWIQQQHESKTVWFYHWPKATLNPNRQHTNQQRHKDMALINLVNVKL